jgi:biotin carboxyl carrier protein
MPCKVLSVLKKDGQNVDVGEIGMVVESMKMEMNIFVGARGKFKAMFRKGDSVGEGMVLFSIT